MELRARSERGVDRYTLVPYNALLHLPQLVRLIHEMAAEHGVVAPTYAHRINELQHHFLMMLLHDREYVGFCTGRLQTLDWEDRQVGELIFMYVQKKHRSFYRVKAFVDAFADWVRERGVTSIEFYITNNDRLVQLLTKHFDFKPTTVMVRKEL